MNELRLAVEALKRGAVVERSPARTVVRCDRLPPSLEDLVVKAMLEANVDDRLSVAVSGVGQPRDKSFTVGIQIRIRW